MVLTEAFAAGTPVIASEHRRLRRRGHRRRGRRPRPAGRPAAPGRGAAGAEPRARAPRAHGRGGAESAQRYAWPRGRRAGRARLRAGGLGPRAGQPRGERLRPAHRARARRRRRARPGAPAALARPAAGRARAAATGPRGGSASVVAAIVGVGLTFIAAQRIGVDRVVTNIVRSDVDLGAGRDRADDRVDVPARRSPGTRSPARRCRGNPLRRRDVASATMVGVLMSATLPARLGEPARAMVLARRTGRMRETFPVLLGTLGLAERAQHRRPDPARGADRLLDRPLPLELGAPVPVQPRAADPAGRRRAGPDRGPPGGLRAGRPVDRDDPRRAAQGAHAGWSSSATRGAARWPRSRSWRPGRSSCSPASRCSRRSASTTSRRSASAPRPRCCSRSTSPPRSRRRPSNIGVFQLATISVLTTGFGVCTADALAYGVILQAVEIATAVALGLPALVREGVTWQDMRLRALSAAPVRLAPRQRRRREADELA